MGRLRPGGGMRDEDEPGWGEGAGATAARRKLGSLLAGDFLLYEVTGDREMRVLRFPRAVTRPAGSGGRASPRAGGAAPPPP